MILIDDVLQLPDRRKKLFVELIIKPTFWAHFSTDSNIFWAVWDFAHELTKLPEISTASGICVADVIPYNMYNVWCTVKLILILQKKSAKVLETKLNELKAMSASYEWLSEKLLINNVNKKRRIAIFAPLFFKNIFLYYTRYNIYTGWLGTLKKTKNKTLAELWIKFRNNRTTLQCDNICTNRFHPAHETLLEKNNRKKYYCLNARQYLWRQIFLFM
jgi:hypothetical protein